MGAIDHLPEHLKSRRTAEAITAPSAILLAGAGAAAGILGGLPIVAAAGIGALAYGLRVAFGLPKRATGPRIDPGEVDDPWRHYVTQALDAQHRFDRIVRQAREGPVRDRLAEIGARLRLAVQECWRIAQRGDALVDGVNELEPANVRRELAALTDGRPPDWMQADPESLPPEAQQWRSTVESFRAQLGSIERLSKVANDATERLRLLDARLDESVARAVELSLQADDVAALSPLGDDVEALVGEMETLRQGLEEAGRASAAGAV